MGEEYGREGEWERSTCRRVSGRGVHVGGREGEWMYMYIVHALKAVSEMTVYTCTCMSGLSLPFALP